MSNRVKKLFTIIVSLSFIAVACTPNTVAPAPVTPTPAQPKEDEAVFCTQDAKQCSDGSFVSRVAPDCNFAACPKLAYQTLYTSDIQNLVGPFTFSAKIPTNWKIEVVPGIEAMNIYDPNANDKNNLEKSQIFVRYFKANNFLTLNTVTIFKQTQTTNKGKPTVIYDIEKKSGVVNFPSQPSWRNERHLVTDIRQTDSNPSVFYVFAQRPDLDQKIFDHFLQTLEFGVKKRLK